MDGAAEPERVGLVTDWYVAPDMELMTDAQVRAVNEENPAMPEGRPVLIRLDTEGPRHDPHGPQRQMGWIGHTGNVYRLDEGAALKAGEPGGFTPFYIDEEE